MGKKLTTEEKEKIMKWKKEGVSVKEIGRRLNRSASTIASASIDNCEKLELLPEIKKLRELLLKGCNVEKASKILSRGKSTIFRYISSYGGRNQFLSYNDDKNIIPTTNSNYTSLNENEKNLYEQIENLIKDQISKINIKNIIQEISKIVKNEIEKSKKTKEISPDLFSLNNSKHEKNDSEKRIKNLEMQIEILIEKIKTLK